jgi:hypothetical protein
MAGGTARVADINQKAVMEPLGLWLVLSLTALGTRRLKSAEALAK